MSVTSGAYQLEFDPERQLLVVRMTGLWDSSTVRSYRTALVAQISSLKAGGRFPATIGALVDLREQAILPKDTAEAMQEVTENEWPTSNPAAVILSPSKIQKSQTGRMSVRLQNIAFFTEEQEALAWLKGYFAA
ncbi:hypothetical protein [Rhizorhabdus dicambivorans]|nr:hypothetical protein [Rhizorhabdus dicambivorans]